MSLAVDWEEVRDLAARTMRSPISLMHGLHARGTTSLLVSPITLNELLQEKRILLVNSQSGDVWDTTAVRIPEPPGFAAQLMRELSARGVEDLSLRRVASGAELSREHGTFSAVKDIAAGYDSLLLATCRQAKLVPVFRIYEDPWLSREAILAELKSFPLSGPANGVLFSSDDLPGGLAALPIWRSWIQQFHIIQLLPEFRPALASWKMAKAAPANTYRTHAIPAAELKDLKPSQQLSRWRRAVNERSCRFLVVHVAPSNSLDDFFHRVASLGDMLRKDHWVLGFPEARAHRNSPGSLPNIIGAATAFAMAVLTPLFALRRGMEILPRKWLAFLRISCLTLAGSLLVSALAQNPQTRLEIMPFRGIKAAFLLSWLACWGLLYDRQEIRRRLKESVKRWEILAAGAVLAVVAYILLRTGNSASVWTHPGELAIRECLEKTLVARPRFKEFLGHPALLVGLYLQSLASRRHPVWDGRPWLWLGMLGQISIVNTFCHLHSSMRFELWRTLNGFVIGSLIGVLVIKIIKMRWRLEE